MKINTNLAQNLPMKTIYTLAFTLVILQAVATTGCYSKLCTINQYWLQQKDVPAEVFNCSFAFTETEWIQYHLSLVENSLRNKTTTHLTAQQKHNREICLNYLHQYWQQAKFPLNENYSYRTPIFIDKHDNFCAVGYLIKASGNEPISRMIAANTNLAYVKQMQYPELLAWANQNGFSIDELAWIQPGYPPATIFDDLDKGVNGNVYDIEVDTATGTVYAGGAFTQASGINCNHVAMFVNGVSGWNWVTAGEGLNGTVNSLLLHNNKLYAGGAFTMSGNIVTNNIAVYDIATNQWQAMGSLDGTVKTIALYNGDIYVGGDFTGAVAKWTGNSWQAIAQGTIGGSVHVLEVWEGKLIIGGDFAILTNTPDRNIISYNGSQFVLMGTGTINPVNDFEYFNGKLLAGCEFGMGPNSYAIAYYNGSNWQTLLSTAGNGFSSVIGSSIKKMLAINDSTVLIGGNFICYINMPGGTFGSDLMAYMSEMSFGNSTVSNVFVPLVLLDSSANSTVHAIAATGSDYIYGGEFTTYNRWTTAGYEPLNHIASKAVYTVGISKIMYQPLNANVYPNPTFANSSFQINSDEEIVSVTVFDILGNKVLEKTTASFNTVIGTDNFTKGCYTVHVTGKQNNRAITKIVIQ